VMEKIAVHMRISGVNVSDDDVNSRRAAAASLATSWGKVTNTSNIASKAADIAQVLSGDGTAPPVLAAEVEKAIQKKSPSYLYVERPLDAGVCAGMAAISIVGSSPGTLDWTVADVYATALWSALAYQPALEAERREHLRREVLDAAANHVVKSAENARERTNVPDPSGVKITIGESNVVSSDFQDAMAGTVTALRRNAALDREELDFLWWAQLNRSRLLNKQLTEIAEPTRIVAAGIEGAKMLRRLPCEVHREIVLRTLDQDPELDLGEMLEALGDDRRALGAAFMEGNVASHPSIFPLLHALTTGESNLPGGSVKRHVSEWGERALLEATFAKMLSQGPGKL